MKPATKEKKSIPHHPPSTHPHSANLNFLQKQPHPSQFHLIPVDLDGGFFATFVATLPNISFCF